MFAAKFAGGPSVSDPATTAAVDVDVTTFMTPDGGWIDPGDAR